MDGRVDRINADHAPAGGTYPTSRWKKGDVVKDEFVVYVPPTMPVRGLTIYIGFWDPKNDSRMVVKNPEAVRHDGNNRVMLAQIPVIVMTSAESAVAPGLPADAVVSTPIDLDQVIARVRALCGAALV